MQIPPFKTQIYTFYNIYPLFPMDGKAFIISLFLHFHGSLEWSSLVCIMDGLGNLAEFEVYIRDPVNKKTKSTTAPSRIIRTPVAALLGNALVLYEKDIGLKIDTTPENICSSHFKYYRVQPRVIDSDSRGFGAHQKSSACSIRRIHISRGNQENDQDTPWTFKCRRPITSRSIYGSGSREILG